MKKFEEYLVSKGLSGNTVRSYLSDLALFFRFTGSVNIKRNHVFSYRRYLQDQGKNASTINRALSAIRKYGEFNGQYDLVLSDDFITIQKTYSSPVVVTEKDVAKFLRSLKKWDSYRNYCIAVLIVNTGLRISEVLNLKLFDFANLSSGEVIIMGKGNKQRKVVINNGARDVLDYYLKNERKKYKYAAVSDYVFASNKAGKLNPATIQRVFKEHDPRIYPHMLRHFFATNVYEKGLLNLRQLQEQLGHSKLDTVQKYTHPNRNTMIENLNSKEASFV